MSIHKNGVPALEQQLIWLREEKYAGKESLKGEWEADIKRLARCEPLDYVIGFSRFLGCEIDLSLHPLIPRPETEYWTEKAIGQICNTLLPLEQFTLSSTAVEDKVNCSLRCLDMFAGSGCIGIAVLKHIPQAHMDFAEMNATFCRQIKINLARNAITARRARVLRSDMFAHVKGKYDYILANPPYCATKSPRRVQASVRVFEPQEALWSGSDGLEVIKKFLRNAKGHLRPNGTLYMEFDYPQKRETARIGEVCGYKDTQFHKDQFGRWRYLTMSI